MTLKVHFFACTWMHKRQFFGMKIKPFSPRSIEFVALYGVIESVSMGTMHAQLMRATCQRVEIHAVFSCLLIVGYSFPAVHSIDNLAWPVIQIRTQGQADLS